ncbi:MAG: monofunctional biosynthetic peptidoglycan transglycosylase [Rhodobacteraceae bacterium]|nr:MAG: monofunctional biosynthetic peptidoglycan transglycosylase [Paracoccaceae bacterium]
MAKRPSRPAPRKARATARTSRRGPLGWAVFIALRSVTVLILGTLALVVLTAFVNPPTNLYMWSESRRLGGVQQDWVALDEIAPVMARSAVAAEDANFCLHWGFDVVAIRAALEDGGTRGASTISQQVVKNVFLWQGRSWLRKALEAGYTVLLELLLDKRRILELHLNIAEYGRGVYGVEAAAQRYFGRDAGQLGRRQAALLVTALPNPRRRRLDAPGPAMRARQDWVLRQMANLGGTAWLARLDPTR